jgi:hypothetical protein
MKRIPRPELHVGWRPAAACALLMRLPVLKTVMKAPM